MRIAWTDFALLDDAGFGLHEKRALVTLAVHGVADAATLCRDGDIPTSKIYAAMEKLAALGLAEMQRSRPKRYAALPREQLVQRLVELARERAEAFAKASAQLQQAFARLPEKSLGGQRRVDLALGIDGHAKRHLSRLAAAEREIVSYLEPGDVAAIDRARELGIDVLRAGARRRVKHRIVFGFDARTAPTLMAFLKRHAAHLRGISGVRYAGRMGHPFHVIDARAVIVALDHPFIAQGRFASVLVEDADLAAQLTGGFDTLWHRALADLRELRAWPERAAGA